MDKHGIQYSLIDAKSNGDVRHFDRTPNSTRKLRGGYYTPSAIAAFLAEWAVQSGQAQVLEPSAGDGEIVAAVARRLGGSGRVTAVELDHEEGAKAAARGGSRANVVTGDVFRWYQRRSPDGFFDAVVGNPPYIRYQDFPEAHRREAFELIKDEGLKPSRLMNAWLPFVVLATRVLRPGGRLALVLPAELLQVSYAAQLREYLTRKYSQLTIVTFRQLVFSGIQQETVLLLGIRDDTSIARMSIVEMDGMDDLYQSERIRKAPEALVELDHAREKWTQYYLTPLELGLIREIEASEAFCRLGELAEVDVGIVTGRNEFFVLSLEEAERLELRSWCVPLVGRSAQIPGLALYKEEWQHLVAQNGKCLLLQLGAVDRHKLSGSALAYVESGESKRFHQGYKCSIRLPRWWDLPSPWVPDAFLLRQIYDAPRIVLNRAGATCTDTIHRVRIRSDIRGGWLPAVSLNSLTVAFAEIRGRSYGGGVLELEPSEAEGLPFPKPDSTSQGLLLDDLDYLLRCKRLESVMSEVDRVVLSPSGLSDRDLSLLRGVWQKLRDRRRRRTHKTKKA